MASIDTLAVILGEATDVYLQSKSLDYAQAQFMQKQANIEIDRQLATERYNNALQADVYKSQIQRLGRRSDALLQSIIQSQAKYQGLTGELFKLTPESKTSNGFKHIDESKYCYRPNESRYVKRWWWTCCCW